MKHLLNNKFAKILLLVIAVGGVYLLSEHTDFLDTKSESTKTTFIEEANLPIYDKGTPVNFIINWKNDSLNEIIITLSNGKQTYKVGCIDDYCSTKLPAGTYTITNIESDNINYKFDIVGLKFTVPDSTSPENIKLVIDAIFKFDLVRFIKSNFIFVIVLIIYIVLYTQTNKDKIINKIQSIKNKSEEVIGS